MQIALTLIFIKTHEEFRVKNQERGDCSAYLHFIEKERF